MLGPWGGHDRKRTYEHCITRHGCQRHTSQTYADLMLGVTPAHAVMPSGLHGALRWFASHTAAYLTLPEPLLQLQPLRGRHCCCYSSRISHLQPWKNKSCFAA
jgi:hypothetical protein